MPNTILVVDDYPPSIPGLVDALTSAGLTTITADGFAEALKVLAGLEPELLITSVRLGPYNGLHLVMRARALYPNAAAILIGPSDPMLARDARALGAAAYLATLSPDPVVFEAMKILNRPGAAGDVVDVPALAVKNPASAPLLGVPL
jgi:CheY-like chemotaxis protein